MKEEAKKLIEMVKKGIPDKEIMKELGIQTGTSLTDVPEQNTIISNHYI